MIQYGTGAAIVPGDPAAVAAQPPAPTASVAPVAQPLVVPTKTSHRPAKSGSSARAAPSAAGKPRPQRPRPDPLNPPPGAASRDGLLPLTM